MRGAAVILLVVGLAAAAERERPLLHLGATVTRVLDGNNLRLVDYKGTEHQVRLQWVEAPELNQPGGRDAQAAVRELADGKSVEVEHREFDMRGRIVGRVLLADRTCVNLELVRRGLAWCYPPGAAPPEYREAEAAARQDRRGLWKAEHPVPPWHWRRGVRAYRPGLENDPGPGELPWAPSSNERAIIGHPQ